MPVIAKIVETKSRLYDASLVGAGAFQAHNFWAIPNNILTKLIEDPIITVIGLLTIVLLSLRILRMIQKMVNKEKD